MAAKCDCCNCVVESDYGTSVVVGDGSAASPFSVDQASVPYLRPAARVRRTTDQSISNSAFNVVSFDAEVFDSDGFWVVGSPTLITIPHQGLYVFGGNGKWATNATGTRELAIRLNGSEVLRTNDQPVHPTFGGANSIWQTVGYQYRLEVGDTLELLARQESGGALNLEAEADDSVVFWIFYAGKTI